MTDTQPSVGRTYDEGKYSGVSGVGKPSVQAEDELRLKLIDALWGDSFESNYDNLDKGERDLIDRLMQLIQADRSRHEAEVRIDENKTSMAWQFTNEADLFAYIEYQQNRIASLQSQLKKDGDAKT